MASRKYSVTKLFGKTLGAKRLNGKTYSCVMVFTNFLAHESLLPLLLQVLTGAVLAH